MIQGTKTALPMGIGRGGQMGMTQPSPLNAYQPTMPSQGIQDSRKKKYEQLMSMVALGQAGLISEDSIAQAIMQNMNEEENNIESLGNIAALAGELGNTDISNKYLGLLDQEASGLFGGTPSTASSVEDEYTRAYRDKMKAQFVGDNVTMNPENRALWEYYADPSTDPFQNLRYDPEQGSVTGYDNKEGMLSLLMKRLTGEISPEQLETVRDQAKQKPYLSRAWSTYYY